MTRSTVQRSLGVLLIFASFFALGTAWYAQHVLGEVPCELCLLERVPWRFIFVAGVLAFIVPRRVGFWSLIVGLFLLVASVFLSFVHVGVEHHWWESPFPSCRAPILHGTTYRERLLSMPLRPTKPCDAPSYVFGLPFSMAALEGVYSGVLAAIVIVGLVRPGALADTRRA